MIDAKGLFYSAKKKRCLVSNINVYQITTKGNNV